MGKCKPEPRQDGVRESFAFGDGACGGRVQRQPEQATRDQARAVQCAIVTKPTKGTAEARYFERYPLPAFVAAAYSVSDAYVHASRAIHCCLVPAVLARECGNKRKAQAPLLVP